MSAEMCACGRNRIFSGDPFCNECMEEFKNKLKEYAQQSSELIKFEIKTTISVKENITDIQISKILNRFEELAWENDDSIYQPRVTITKL